MPVHWVLVLVFLPESLGAMSKQASILGATKEEKMPAKMNAQD